MGLLEKAGNVQAEEKKATKVVKAEKEAENYNQAVAKAAKKEESSPKESKKAAKVKKAKKPKKVKTPRAKKERVTKELPEGFVVVGRARSTGLWLIDSTVNWGLFLGIVFIMAFSDPDPTYLITGCLLICVSNLIFMPLWTKKTIGNWITMTQYVNTRGNTPMFLFHVMKNLRIPMNLTGILLFLFWLPVFLSEADMPNIFVTLFGVMFFSLSIADSVIKRFHQQNFGLWEFSFGGIWLVKATKSESSSGNKFLKRLESLSDYSESKGWLEDKE